MSAWTVNSESALQAFIGDMRDLFKQHKFVKVSAKIGKARSLDQNAISHCWYEQLARELKEDDALGWKAYCKLHHGVPILRAEDEQFRDFYDRTIRVTLAYDQKLDAMKFLPVTSLMSKPQLSKYLEAVRDDFLKRGVMLEFPEEAA